MKLPGAVLPLAFVVLGVISGHSSEFVSLGMRFIVWWTMCERDARLRLPYFALQFVFISLLLLFRRSLSTPRLCAVVAVFSSAFTQAPFK